MSLAALLPLAGVLAAGLFVHLLLRRRLGPERLESFSRRSEGTLFCAILAAMILLSALQVVLRNFFQVGLLWIDPLVRSLLLWVAFLGAFAAAGRARHIRIDVLGRLLPERAGRMMDRFLSFLSAVVCVFLAEGGLTYVREEYAYGSPPFLGVPSWVTQSILFWGFVLLAYRFLVQTFWPTPAREES